MVALQEYVDAHATAVKRARGFVSDAEAREGGPTAEDTQRINDAVDEAAAARERLDAMERLQAEEGHAAKRDEVVEETRAVVAQAALTAKPSRAQLAPEVDLRAMGSDSLGGTLGQVHIDIAGAARVDEMVRKGATRKDVLADFEQRALVVGTDSAGGYTVPTTTAMMIYDFMQDIGGLRRAGATILTTMSGEDLKLPVTATHNAPSGTLETAESAAIAETEDTLGEVTLKAYKYTGRMDASRELLTDTTSDIEQFILEGIFRTIGIKMETRHTLGTGSSMPKGVLHSPPAAQTTTTAGSNTIAKDDIYDVKFALDPFYLANEDMCRWMMHSAVYKEILQIPVGTNDARPLFQESLIAGEPNRILGTPVTYNQFAPGTLADNDIAIAYGHFGHGYVIRQVSGITIESSMHARFVNQEVVFLGSVRCDGQIRDERAIERMKIKA